MEVAEDHQQLEQIIRYFKRVLAEQEHPIQLLELP
jgi:hypothetical protein